MAPEVLLRFGGRIVFVLDDYLVAAARGLAARISSSIQA